MTADQEVMDCWVEHFKPLRPDQNPKHWYDFIRRSSIERLYRAIDAIAVDPTRKHAPGLEDLKKTYWRLKQKDESNLQADGKSKFPDHKRCGGSGMLPILEAGPSAADAKPWPHSKPLPANFYQSEGWIPCECEHGNYINRYGLKGTGASYGLNYDQGFLDKFRGLFAHDDGGALQTWINNNTIPDTDGEANDE